MTHRSRPGEPAESNGAGSPAPRPAHVLVVDDQPIVREFLSEVLKIQGHRVSVAETGPEALEIAKRDPPQVLLTDLKMDGMAGAELIRHIRETQPPVLTVLITRIDTDDRTVTLIHCGTYD